MTHAFKTTLTKTKMMPVQSIFVFCYVQKYIGQLTSILEMMSKVEQTTLLLKAVHVRDIIL